MEIINDTPDNGKKKPDVTRPRTIYLGLLLMAIGGVWLLWNLDMIDNDLFRTIFSWQSLLMAVGVYLMVVRKWMSGLIVFGIGLLFLFSRFWGIYINIGVILPVIVIAAGAAMLINIGKKRQG